MTNQTDKAFLTERLFQWQGKLKVLLEVSEVVNLMAKAKSPLEAKKPTATPQKRLPGRPKKEEPSPQP